MMSNLKNIAKWIAVDGLLHFLVCYAIMLALTPIIGIWMTLGVTLLVALFKEAKDYFIEEDNNKEQVLHDIICDAVGIAMSVLTMAVWWMCNV